MKTKEHRTAKNTAATLLLAACVLFAALPAHAQDISTGLVGHWKLDETTGTTATDNSVSGNDGTMGGGLDAANDTTGGKIGTSLVFDGTDDWINTNADIDYGPGNAITVSAWVKFTSCSGVCYIVSKDRYLGSSPYTLLVDVNVLEFTIDSTANHVQSATGYDDGAWHHVIGVFDGTTASLYVDGNLEDSHVGFTPLSNDESVAIGASEDTPTYRPFDGAIDDVRIYNRALSIEDIAVLASGTAPGGMRYNDETEAVEYHDGFEWLHTGLGSYSPNAVEFDGTNDDLARGSDLSNISDCKKWSGSFWFRRNAIGSHQYVYDGAGTSGYIRLKSDNKFHILGRNSGSGVLLDIETSATITDSDWHHVMWSIDLSDNSKRHIYLDGVSDLNVVTYTDGILNNTMSDHVIGDSAGGGSDFNGDLADFWMDYCTYIDLSVAANRRKFISANGAPMYLGPDGSLATGNKPDIFLSGDTDEWHTNKGTGGGFTENGALTDATTQPGEPDLDGLVTTGLYAHWKFDETTGGTLVDAVGDDDLTWTDGINDSVAEETTDGKVGTAIDFDGTDDRVEGLFDDGALDNLGALSTCIWFYSDANQSERFYSWKYSSNNYPASLAILNNSGNLEATVRIDDVNYAATSPVEAAGFWNNAWHHTCLTFDRTLSGSRLKLYIDGIVVATDDATDNNIDFDTFFHTAYIEIGQEKHWGREFDGKHDDARFYTRALTQEEVQIIARGECGSPQKPTGSIIYNTDDKVMQYCNGTDWVAMGPVGGTGGGGCASPAGSAGDIKFNDDIATMQYCNSEDWVGMARSLSAPTDGLVGHWKLDETTGTTADDATANNNDGTMNGGLDAANDAAEGRIGVAGLVFDNVDDEIDIGDVELTNDAITISLWTHPIDTSETFVGKWEGVQRAYIFSINASSKAEFSVSDDGLVGAGSRLQVISSTSLTLNEWNFVTATFDGQGNGKVYINGIEDASATDAGVTGIFDGTANLRIGNDPVSATAFDGAIDEVRIYDRALSAAEVNQLYHARW